MRIAKVLLTAGMTVACACTTPEQRSQADQAEIRKNVAKQIERICALDEAERDAELRKLGDETGLELYCAP